jgi:hypothetical protein
MLSSFLGERLKTCYEALITIVGEHFKYTTGAHKVIHNFLLLNLTINSLTFILI